MELRGNKGRGGRRAGAGRKPGHREYSEDFKRKVLAAAKRKETETGRSVFDEFVAALYDRELFPTARVGLFKIWAEMFVTKQSHAVVEKYDYGPVIGLPPVMDMPEEYRRKDEEIH